MELTTPKNVFVCPLLTQAHITNKHFILMLGVVVIIKVMVGAIKKIFEAVIILVLKASTQAKKVFFFF